MRASNPPARAGSWLTKKNRVPELKSLLADNAPYLSNIPVKPDEVNIHAVQAELLAGGWG